MGRRGLCVGSSLHCVVECRLTTFSGSQTTRSVRRILWLSRQQLILLVLNTDLTNNPSGYECPSVRFPVLSSLARLLGD